MGYDIVHFEALGAEAQYLNEETILAKRQGGLPSNHKYFITPLAVQECLKGNPGFELPELITVKTHSLIPEDYFEGKKKSIITRSAGYDHLEHLVKRVNISSLREYCVNAVSQTAIKLLYAIAGELNLFTKNTADFNRENVRSFMEFGKQRIVTVFGVGKIGKAICDLAAANGLTVQGVDIREEQLFLKYNKKIKFVSKEEALCTSDIFINAMSLNKNSESEFFNIGYFSKDYFDKASKPLIFINVSRGEIAPESDLLNLYDQNKFIGIGLDVFTKEPQFSSFLQGEYTDDLDLIASKELVQRSLDRTANIYVQPHQAFNSDIAAKTKACEAIKLVVGWYRNGREKFDEQLPYY